MNEEGPKFSCNSQLDICKKEAIRSFRLDPT